MRPKSGSELIGPNSEGGFTKAERQALQVIAWRSPHVVERTRNVIEVRFPDLRDRDFELTLLVTAEAVELRLPTIEWTMGAYAPAMSSVLWKRLTWAKVEEAGVATVLDRLAAALGRTLRTCRHCREKFLPSRMAGRACHGCATEFEGVVY